MQAVWLLAVATAAGFAYWLWSWRRRRAELKRASEVFISRTLSQPPMNSPPTYSWGIVGHSENCLIPSRTA